MSRDFWTMSHDLSLQITIAYKTLEHLINRIF